MDCAEALRRVEELLSSVEDPRFARILEPSDEIRLRAILYRLAQLRENPVEDECRELLEYTERVVGELHQRLAELGSAAGRAERP